MSNIRERIERIVVGDKLDNLKGQVSQLSEINARLVEAYHDGPYVIPPDQLLAQLREWYDPQLVDQLVDLAHWEVVGGYGGYDEAERARAVADSRRAYKYSILARYAVNLWTSYALGTNVQIVAEDEDAQKVWAEFQDARRNRALLAKDRIDELSRWLLVTGERFLVYYASTQDGETTVRSVQPEQIVRILCNPDDSTEPWFYERQWQSAGSAGQRTLYYADWETWFGADAAGRQVIEDRWNQVKAAYNLPANARRADEENNNTAVVMQFVPFVQLDEGSPRGWPLLAPHGTPWFRAHRDFMQDRLAVSRGVASYVRRYKTAGGSRAVDAIRSALASAYQFGSSSETNFPPVAGSSEVVNKAVDVEDLPLRTGAGDAKADGEMFAWYALLAAGIFPHYAGMGDAYRLATASAMEKPLELQFNLYRAQLSAMFREMVEIVLRFQERFDGASFENYDVQISTDRMVHLDAGKITESLSRLWRDVITPLLQVTSIPREVLDNLLVFSIQSTAEALGKDNPEEMVNLEMFSRAATAEAELAESHIGEVVQHTCPLCGWPQALSYPGHGSLLVCARCHKTYDPEVEL